LFIVRIMHLSLPKFNFVIIISILGALAINSDIPTAKNYLQNQIRKKFLKDYTSFYFNFNLNP
jgi:hypothetical protein